MIRTAKYLSAALCAVLCGAAAKIPAGVSAHGVTLRSVTITMPADDAQFPGGAAADAINGNCLSCHSAAMVLAQPALQPAVWQTEVAKMIKVYKAPIDAKDVPAILAYLTHLKPGP